MHSIIYEDIDEDLVKKAAIKTKGGCGPCGLDADNWRRILVSSRFGSSPLDLRTSVENFVKRLCNTNIHLPIPLNKISGVRPIGVGQVLRRTAGKVVMYIAKKRCKTYSRITPSMRRWRSRIRSSHSCNIVMRWAIWYHLCNLKNVKNTHGGVLILASHMTFTNKMKPKPSF